MMEWQPIETAPIDTHVRLGRWRDSYRSDTGLDWETCVGIAWETERGLFRNKIKRGWRSEYTHWQPLPEPPVQS